MKQTVIQVQQGETSILINTGLQPGEGHVEITRNRFNGFSKLGSLVHRLKWVA